MKKKLLVIQVAGLSENIGIKQIRFQQIQSIFPAVTCPVQASFRTGQYADKHGMIANGLYFNSLNRVMFWEQSARLVSGERIWHKFRRNGAKVAMLFWQQSLGEDVDICLSPAPIHKHHGGMILDCYSQPSELYADLCKRLGSPFKLNNYWGPFASAKVGRWIADATCHVLNHKDYSPDLCLTYIPGLDYNYQRYGPNGSPKCQDARQEVKSQLDQLLTCGVKHGYDVLIFGDYQIAPVNQAVFPNRILAEAGYLKTRQIKSMQYPDFYASDAFAMADHQVAHIYLNDQSKLSEIGNLFEHAPGIDGVYTQKKMRDLRISHKRSGNLVITAATDSWLAYPWWHESREAPEFASHVDIHNKPGFDPCELFLGWPPGSISSNTSKIRGSHGTIGKGCEVIWGSTVSLDEPVKDIASLGKAVKHFLDE